MERDFKGVWIPKEIYLNKDLSWSEKILLIEIDSLDNEMGCFASNDYFAQFLDISPTRISKMVSKLKDLKLIEQTSFDGRQRILKSNISSKQLCTKVQGSLEEKFKHNNIDNNIKKTTNGFNSIIDSYTSNQDLKNTIYDFIKMRKAIKKVLTDRALSLILNKLNTMTSDDNTKILILNQSIENSWQGIFPLKQREDKPNCAAYKEL